MTNLGPLEVRLLGSLIEKELSTPDYYPMTIRAITAACNQKSNRDPVIEVSDDDVLQIITTLQRKGLVGSASSSYHRVPKYRHALSEVLNLPKQDLAILASLMLRGPETVGELRGRTSRMATFESIEAVEIVLDRLISRESPLVTKLPRQRGQKEQRFAHLFAGKPEIEPEVQPVITVDHPDKERIDRLEAEVLSLQEQIQTLSTDFKAFRRQFE